jgi:hypothetical protein
MGLTRPTLSLRCRGPTFGVALTSTAHRLGRRCRNMRSPSEKYEYDSPLFTPSTARSASIVTPDSLVLSLWKLWRAYLSSVRATAPNLPTAQPVRPSGARRMEFHCGQMMRQPTVAVLHTVECVSAKLRVTASCPATPATNTTSLPPASRARFQVGVTGHMSARRASLVQLGPYGSPSHPSPVNNLRSDANPDSMCLLMLAQVSGWLEGRWSVLRRLSLSLCLPLCLPPSLLRQRKAVSIFAAPSLAKQRPAPPCVHLSGVLSRRRTRVHAWRTCGRR